MTSEEMMKTIDEFIENHFYRYALMIDGPWGCGKTYFITEELIPHIKDRKYKDQEGKEIKKDLNYLSLYGVKNTSDISEMLCTQAIEDKIEKIGNGETIQKVFKKDKIIDKTSKSFQFTSLITNAVVKKLIKVADVGDEMEIRKLASLFPNFDNNVIILDDLERCSCDINEIMGFINNFVEHSDAKVILVANEQEIGKWQLDHNQELQMLVALQDRIIVEAETAEDKDKKLIQGDKYQEDQTHFSPEKLELRRQAIFNENDKYQRIKEKVVGKTIRYEPDLKEVFLNLIENNIKNPQLTEALKHEIDTLVEYAVKDEHKNIRTFQFFLEKIDSIFNVIENKYAVLHLVIIDYCYRLSIRFKSGKKLPKWELGEEYGDQGFGESEFSSDRQHGFKFIDELVRDSHIDSACVNAVLSKFEKKVIEEGKLKNDPCQLIKDWYKSEHEQVEQWIKEIIDNLRKDRYSLILYPEIIRTFADLQSYGLFTKEANEAFDLIQEKLQNADSTQIRLFSPERHSLFSGDGAAIYREKMKLYTEIIANREKKNRKEEYQRIIAEKDNDWIQDILDIIKEERVVEGWSFLYWLEPKDILARLKECNNYQLWNFRFLLNNIYNNHVYYEHFPDDYDHLIELKKLIKELDTSGYNGIKQQAFKWIERDLERTLRRFQEYEHDPDIIIKEE